MEYFKLTAALHNLGCKVNAYEADAMLEELRRAGIRIVPWESAAADIYIINTCSVTNIADRKSRQMIHKARGMNPAAVVIAAGCYVQARAAELQMDTAVDILVGNQEKGRRFVSGRCRRPDGSDRPGTGEPIEHRLLRVGYRRATAVREAPGR